MPGLAVPTISAYSLRIYDMASSYMQLGVGELSALLLQCHPTLHIAFSLLASDAIQCLSGTISILITSLETETSVMKNKDDNDSEKAAPSAGCVRLRDVQIFPQKQKRG